MRVEGGREFIEELARDLEQGPAAGARREPGRDVAAAHRTLHVLRRPLRGVRFVTGPAGARRLIGAGLLVPGPPAGSHPTPSRRGADRRKAPPKRTAAKEPAKRQPPKAQPARRPPRRPAREGARRQKPPLRIKPRRRRKTGPPTAKAEAPARRCVHVVREGERRSPDRVAVPGDAGRPSSRANQLGHPTGPSRSASASACPDAGSARRRGGPPRSPPAAELEQRAAPGARRARTGSRRGCSSPCPSSTAEAIEFAWPVDGLVISAFGRRRRAGTPASTSRPRSARRCSPRRPAR